MPRSKCSPSTPQICQDKEAFNALGKEIQEANVQHVTALMATFKDSLEVWVVLGCGCGGCGMWGIVFGLDV